MSETTAPSLGDWHYGIDPGVAGLTVRSLRRVDLPLGEAFRLELAGSGADGDDVHVQYLVDTDAGPWALWIACPPDDLGRHEALLAEVLPRSAGDPRDQPPTSRPRRAPLAGWDEG